MFTRIILATILTILIVSQASAGVSFKEKLKRLKNKQLSNEVAKDEKGEHDKTNTKQSGNEVAADSSSEVVLPDLPPLPGNTWREWLVPTFPSANNGFQTTYVNLRITNFGKAKAKVKIECHEDSGPQNGRLFLKKIVVIEAIKNKKIELKKEGWCRVSADRPVLVYINIRDVRKPPFGPKNAIGISLYNHKVIQAIPYPAQ